MDPFAVEVGSGEVATVVSAVGERPHASRMTRPG